MVCRSSHDFPPQHLDSALSIDPSEWARRDVYDLVTSLVVPRPVAWISTLSETGVRNLAPYSYFNLVADHPPHVIFSSIGIKDTLRNIEAVQEFVINLAGRDVMHKLDLTSADVPAEVDEFVLAGVTPIPSVRVRPFRVAQSRAQFECLLAGIIPVGNGNIVIGRVVQIHVAPSIWREGQIVPELYDPVVRLSRRYGALSNEYTPEEQPSAHVLGEGE